MSEETELQARIAALAGQINKHKRQPLSQEIERHGSVVHNGSHHPRGAGRWMPYLQGGRPSFKPIKNRTLVLANAGSDIQKSDSRHTSSGPLVTSRAGSKAEIMTKETCEREQRQRQEDQQQRLVRSVRSVPRQSRRDSHGSNTPNQVARILEFDGIKFELQTNGAKLIRLPGAEVANSETPKKVTIADVDFLRTKNGNLVRATTTTQGNIRADTRASQKQCVKFTRHGTVDSRFRATGHIDRTPYEISCRLSGRLPAHADMNLGTCPFGPTCRDRHDPTKIAICKEFFAKGTCPAGKSCDLSHEPDYHRVPACTYFLRGNCTNSACRYAHVVNVPSSALVCRAFATLGYCSKGVECESRHVFECPEYTNHGHCEAHQKGLCALPHVDRASILRKAAKRSRNAGSEDGSDLSSDEEEQMHPNEVDDDSDLDINTDAGDYSHALTQEQDYVSFAPSGRA